MATKKSLEAHKEYVESFASIVTTFVRGEGEAILAAIPQLLVDEFEAARAELWLWDETSRSVYLTHSAGKSGDHRHDYISAGNSSIGKVAEVRKQIENIVLSTFGGDDQEYSRRTALTHISAYPIPTKAELQGVIVAYSIGEASQELLHCWRTFAEMCAIKVPDILAAHEQKKQITQLSLLFEATRLLNSTLDLAELLDLILKIARQEVHADRGSVFLVDHKKKELWSIVASGLDHQEIRVPYGKGIAGKAAITGKTVNVEDAYTVEEFDPSFDQKFGYRTKSLLCMPIRHRTGEIVGVIQLLNKTAAQCFSKEDVEFLTKLSGHMAMALENARLHRESLEKQRMEKELSLAREIQRSLLPDAPPVVPGFDLAVLNDPCFECGGDYYDFLSLGPQSLLLVIADVEGKGVGSALVMSNLQATLRALVMHLHSLEVLAFSLNEMMYQDTKSEKYLSCFLGLVDTRRNGLHYINAGHVPPIIVNGLTGEYRLLDEGGTVIGLFPKAEYRRGVLDLKAGDVLVACTDGILEAAPPHNEDDEYGSTRLAECVSRHRHMTAQQVVDAVVAEVNLHSKHHFLDDRVLMVMKVNSGGKIDSAIPQPALN